MKKTLLLASLLTPMALLAGSYNVSTEPTPRGVLVEEYTGIHCGNCPDGHEIVAAMTESHPQVSAIAIHAGSYATPSAGDPDFITEDGKWINSYYGVESHGYPSGCVNRHDFGRGYITSRSLWTPNAKEVINDNADVNIWASANYDGADKEFTINIEGYYMLEGAKDYNVHVAVTQSRILGPQSGGLLGNEYCHMHMLRYFVTDVSKGEAVSVSDTERFFSKQFKSPVPDDINGIAVKPLDLEVVVFVTESGVDEVVNALTIHPTYSNELAKGKFVVSDNLIPYDGAAFSGRYIDLRLSNYTAKPVSELEFEIKVNGASITSNFSLEEPLAAGETRTLNFEIPEYTKEEDRTLKATLLSADGKSVNCDALEIDMYSAPHVATYGFMIVRADENPEENTWKLYDINDKVVLDCGYVPFDREDVEFPVDLIDGETYYIEVADAWGNGVLAQRGMVKYTNSEHKMQTQNLSIKGFGTRLYMIADKAKNPESGIETIDTDNNVNAPAEYFSIDGRRISNPDAIANGVVIKRQGTKIEKTIIH